MYDFKVGDKVVCVFTPKRCTYKLKLGKIYTLRSGSDNWWNFNEALANFNYESYCLIPLKGGKNG